MKKDPAFRALLDRVSAIAVQGRDRQALQREVSELYGGASEQDRRRCLDALNKMPESHRTQWIEIGEWMVRQKW